MSRAKTLKYSRKGGFIRRFEEMLNSPAYRDLTPVAKCLLEEFQRIYRPNRNGALSISVINAKKLLNVHKDTAGRAFHELAEHGFIKLVKGSYYQERIAREWAITFEEYNGREPTDDWKRWEKDKPVTKLSMKKRYKKSKSGNKVQNCPKNSTRLGTDLGQEQDAVGIDYPILSTNQ